MLASTALDAQNALFPLGMMVCRHETEENWYMFLKELKKKIADRHGLTFVSDRQKGLLESVKGISIRTSLTRDTRILDYNPSLEGFQGLQVASLGGEHERNGRIR